MSSPSQFGPSPQQSGGGGSSVLVIVLIILGVMLLACAGLCGGCYLVARRAGESISKGVEEGIKIALLSPAFAEAEESATSNAEVIQRLGEPVELKTFPQRQGSGELNRAGETIQFDIKGTKGTAIVSAVATSAAVNEPFHVAKITVTFSDGSVIDIPLEGKSTETEKKETLSDKKFGEQP